MINKTSPELLAAAKRALDADGSYATVRVMLNGGADGDGLASARGILRAARTESQDVRVRVGRGVEIWFPSQLTAVVL